MGICSKRTTDSLLFGLSLALSAGFPGLDGFRHAVYVTTLLAAASSSALLITPVAAMAIYPHSLPGELRYDPLRDFAPVAHLMSYQIGFGVTTALPARTLGEYVALVKRDPQAGFYASAAAGSLPHFFGLMFARAAGLQLTHVPYKGTAAVMQAMMSGEIPAAVLTVADRMRAPFR